MSGLSVAIQAALLSAIRWYQGFSRWCLSAHCRYWPSCSQYAAEAIQTHGVRQGLRLALLRLLRCHPLTTGGIDPVPEHLR